MTVAELIRGLQQLPPSAQLTGHGDSITGGLRLGIAVLDPGGSERLWVMHCVGHDNRVSIIEVAE